MSSSAFEVFNLKASFKLDERALENAYYEKSRELHPDRVARGDKSALLKSQEKSAELNRAYQTLRDPEQRLEALLRMSGRLKDEKSEEGREAIPMDLAEEFFGLQEAATEDPAIASKKVRAFIDTVARSAGADTAAIRELAARIDWESASTPENEALIGELLSRRKRRAYLLSLADNARKLGVA
ncbi:MAG: Fe-S protein assembly co-chaperone HscB [Deltaproteobacteria bacterium]|nr:Fe-S protein assembly co-chaperone HscB [Deltaproteobacteria bacterium]